VLPIRNIQPGCTRDGTEKENPRVRLRGVEAGAIWRTFRNWISACDYTQTVAFKEESAFANACATS